MATDPKERREESVTLPVHLVFQFRDDALPSDQSSLFMVIILLAIALRGIKLDLALKYVLVAPVAVALSFLVGYVVKQLPLARNIL